MLRYFLPSSFIRTAMRKRHIHVAGASVSQNNRCRDVASIDTNVPKFSQISVSPKGELVLKLRVQPNASKNSLAYKDGTLSLQVFCNLKVKLFYRFFETFALHRMSFLLRAFYLRFM